MVSANKINADNKNDGTLAKGWIVWVVAVSGWLVCAFFCLVLTVQLEEFPDAYETLFPAVVLMLFCNLFIFLHITSRWGRQLKKLVFSVIRVCVGEGLLLAGLYALGRFAIGY